MFEASENHPCVWASFPVAEALSRFEAVEADGQREAPVQLSRYEARVLLNHYISEIVGIEAVQELFQLYDESDERLVDFMEGRLHRLMDAGLLAYHEAEDRCNRVRQLRGLQHDWQRQEKEAEKGQFTLFFNLSDFQPEEFHDWIDQQTNQGVIVSETFEFGQLLIRRGRYDLIDQKAWSLPDSDPRWKAEVTYAWTGPIDARGGVNLSAALDRHAGNWDESGHCWWIDSNDTDDLPAEFDPEAAAEEHAAWVGDQPVGARWECDWSMI